MSINLSKLLLILMRITSFIVICPGFSFKGLPNILKVALSFSLAIVVYTVIPDMGADNGFLYLIILAVKEILFGLALGYVTRMIFVAAEMAGHLIDFQVGFSMASVYEPTMGSTASNYSKICYWLSICIFFMLDMHHKIIGTLIQSFVYLPLSTQNYSGAITKCVIELFSFTFKSAFNLAVPMIIAALTTDMVLGIVSRTVPQINVLIIGMPLKALVSFFIMLLMLSWLVNSIGGTMVQMPEYLKGFIELWHID